jgi:hypothetical protein
LPSILQELTKLTPRLGNKLKRKREAGLASDPSPEIPTEIPQSNRTGENSQQNNRSPATSQPQSSTNPGEDKGFESNVTPPLFKNFESNVTPPLFKNYPYAGDVYWPYTSWPITPTPAVIHDAHPGSRHHLHTIGGNTMQGWSAN